MQHKLIVGAGVMLLLILTVLGAPAPAAASSNQVAIIEDDVQLTRDPADTLLAFRKLGADMVRVFVPWTSIAPHWQAKTTPNFDASDPAAYPQGAWSFWDTVDRLANQDGLALDFVLTGGAPRWAEGPGIPRKAIGNPNRAWYPSARDFGEFVQAVARRYDGSYPDPVQSGSTLPRVSFWSIWNEPNFGEDLAPEAIDESRYLVAPAIYRSLIDAAWSALQATGHGSDMILIGEFAARGINGPVTRTHPQGLPGRFAQTKPLEFLPALYCLNLHNRPLRGRAAIVESCPATGEGYRSFRQQHPGLFAATGLSDHPYPQDQPPTKDRSKDPYFAAFPEIPRLARDLDRIQRVYGSSAKLPIYNDEYGYITRPPNKGRYVTPKKAAYYLNWAEYLSWRSPRIVSTMQYLLVDPPPSKYLPNGGFDSGLETDRGHFKADYFAYRLPVYLPYTTERRGTRLGVWGCVRPAHYAQTDTGSAQSVEIQFRPGSHGQYKTLATVPITNPRGYFDVRVHFPASGSVRLAWTYPTGDPLFPASASGATVRSRTVKITVR